MWRRQRCPAASGVIKVPEGRGRGAGCVSLASRLAWGPISQADPFILLMEPQVRSKVEEASASDGAGKKNLKYLIGGAGCRLGNSLFELSVTVWKQPGSLRRFYPQKTAIKKQEKVDPNSTFTFKFTDWTLVQTRAEAGPFITRAGRGRGGRAAVRGLGHLD